MLIQIIDIVTRASFAGNPRTTHNPCVSRAPPHTLANVLRDLPSARNITGDVRAVSLLMLMFTEIGRDSSL